MPCRICRVLRNRGSRRVVNTLRQARDKVTYVRRKPSSTELRSGNCNMVTSRKKSQWIAEAQWIRPDVSVGVDAAGEPDRIRLDVPADGRIVVSEVVVWCLLVASGESLKFYLHVSAVFTSRTMPLSILSTTSSSRSSFCSRFTNTVGPTTFVIVSACRPCSPCPASCANSSHLLFSARFCARE